jgi:hypothetical protein
MRADPGPAGGAAAGAPAGPAPWRAVDVDHELLGQLTRAARWWAEQPAWRVSSSHTGGGAIETLESFVAAEVAADARALAMPSGTAALLAALQAVGVRRGDRVGVPAVDWSASAAVLGALGAAPVVLPVDPVTGLLDPSSAELSAARLSAVIAVHLHGLTCDVPAIRRALTAVPIVEDAARAWAARYPDGSPVGSAADACTFSFGSAKLPGAGELGCLVAGDPVVYRGAVRATQHPTRQLLAGIAEPGQDQVMTRVAPAVAILGGYVLHEHKQTVPALRAAGLAVLTDPLLHVPGTVAVCAAPGAVRAVLVAAGPGFRTVDGSDVSAGLSVVTCAVTPGALSRAHVPASDGGLNVSRVQGLCDQLDVPAGRLDDELDQRPRAVPGLAADADDVRPVGFEVGLKPADHLVFTDDEAVVSQQQQRRRPVSARAHGREGGPRGELWCFTGPGKGELSGR